MSSREPERGEVPTAGQLLRVGLRLGVYRKADVARWADAEIEREAVPSVELVELALVKHKDEAELAALLEVVAGPLPIAVETRVHAAWVGRLLAEGTRQLAWAVDELYWRLRDDGAFSDDERASLARIDYAFDLASESIAGTLDDVRGAVIAFCDPYAPLLAQAPPTERASRAV